jgi:inosine-uridine nucleoside N-ribohydrolase
MTISTETTGMGRERVWLDTDPGMGVAGSDIDDGLAILFVLGSPELALEGISLTFGNVSLSDAAASCERILRAAGCAIPFHLGAQSAGALHRPSPAAQAMVDIVDSNPGEITVLAIGPLTNIATAMHLDPGFASKLGRLVIMGGAIDFPPFSEEGEFNFHQDGRAAAEVLAAPCDRTLVTMDLCSQAVLTREYLVRMTANDGRVSRLLNDTVPGWLSHWKDNWNMPGFFPWDPIAAAYLTHPGLFDDRFCRFTVQPEGEQQGRMIGFEVLDRASDAPDAVRVPARLDGEGFLDLLVERVGRVAAREARGK